ncbi:MAG: DUF2203 family protein [Limisphaerales bacterium]
MAFQFRKHYTREQARALLPHVRQWLKRLMQLRDEIRRHDERVAKALGEGCDLGGPPANRWIRALADLQELLSEFQEREIVVKDLERGLVDFPAMLGSKEVFLCWEQDEEDIEFWHELDAGYAGRERL